MNGRRSPWNALIALVGLVLAVPLAAQNAGPPPTDLEGLRDWARTKVESQEGAFKDALHKAIPVLSSSVGNENALVRDTITKLGERAAVFPGIVLERLCAEKNATLRERLGDVLVASGDPSIGALLMPKVPTVDEGVASLLVNIIGRLKPADLLPALEAAATTEKRVPVLAEVIFALARCQSKDALPTARHAIENTEVRIKKAGIDALGLVGQGREDIDILRKLAVTTDPALRDSALRALGHFKGDFDTLKTLHDAVTSSDAATVAAALDGLELAGTKDLSPKFILQSVKTGPAELRERGARLLMRFGNNEGVKHLFAKERADADKNTEDRELQVAIADRYREFGWYEGAVVMYDRALTAKGGTSSQQVMVALARCYARLKRFDESRKKLKQAGYTTFRGFADDADFAEMKESPAFRDLFR